MAYVGPFVLQGLDEAFGLAIGLGPVGSCRPPPEAMPVRDAEEGLGGGVVHGVVCEQLADLDATCFVVGQGTFQEAGRG